MSDDIQGLAVEKPLSCPACSSTNLRGYTREDPTLVLWRCNGCGYDFDERGFTWLIR